MSRTEGIAKLLAEHGRVESGYKRTRCRTCDETVSPTLEGIATHQASVVDAWLREEAQRG